MKTIHRLLVLAGVCAGFTVLSGCACCGGAAGSAGNPGSEGAAGTPGEIHCAGCCSGADAS